MNPLIPFLAGAISMAYLASGFFFLRIWRNGHDRLFLHLGIAFFLFALNHVLVTQLEVTDERAGYTYILRVLGFLLILSAILRKPLSAISRRDPPKL